MNNPKVTIIILNWNGKKDTIECLESLKHITYPNYEILLVDNGSTDGSVECFRKRYPELEIIENVKNLGFAEGNNVGIRRAMEKGVDYMLLLNNDTVVDPNFLGELVMVAESDVKIGLIQSKLLYYDNHTINTTGFFFDIFGSTMHRGRFEIDNYQYDNLTEEGFFYASGACLLITKKLFLELRGDLFDKYLFAYHEDVDLSWIARLLGFKIVYCPTSICFHKEGKTSGRFNPLTAYWGYKNRLRVLIKNYSMKYLVFFLPLAILLEFVFSNLISIYRRDFRYLLSFFKSLLWNLKNLKSTLRMRCFVQSIRKVNDKQIMKYMEWTSLELKFLLKKIHH